MRIVLAVVIAASLAACQREHTLQLLLGPDARTPSLGFLCRQDANPSKLLLERPDVVMDSTVTVSFVVDIVSLGGRLPGCRGEEIIAACADGNCSFATTGETRYCKQVTFPVSLAKDRDGLMTSITEQLKEMPIVTDAPNGPVLIRAVSTAQTCMELATQAIDPAQAVGCAYSCPAVLDDIDGPISLSLDTLNQQCEQQVRACAAFPM